MARKKRPRKSLGQKIDYATVSDLQYDALLVRGQIKLLFADFKSRVAIGDELEVISRSGRTTQRASITNIYQGTKFTEITLGLIR